MRYMVAAITLAGLSVPSLANADTPGRGWISQAKATRILAKRGYHVTKIEADDGHWEGEARKGRLHYEFHVDPHSGRVTKLERDHD